MVHPCLSSDLCYFIPYNFLSTHALFSDKILPDEEKLPHLYKKRNAFVLLPCCAV
jgi:hypothetical protein